MADLTELARSILMAPYAPQPEPAKPPVDPSHLEQITKRLHTLQRRIADVLDICEDRMDIDGNGNPDTFMRIAQILNGEYDR